MSQLDVRIVTITYKLPLWEERGEAGPGSVVHFRSHVHVHTTMSLSIIMGAASFPPSSTAVDEAPPFEQAS